jgi:hypothetical protein
MDPAVSFNLNVTLGAHRMVFFSLVNPFSNFRRLPDWYPALVCTLWGDDNPNVHILHTLSKRPPQTQEFGVSMLSPENMSLTFLPQVAFVWSVHVLMICLLRLICKQGM